jgi:hypothetical protein
LVEIVRESGFMPTGACGVLTLGDIPQALNAAETELYVREHAAEICGNRRGY